MKLTLSALTLSILLISGCSSNNSLYYWGNYQDNLYQTLKTPEVDPTAQIIDLEKLITKASAKDKAVPPGVYGQLGLLYIQTGQLSQAKASFEKEKTLFPESATYMDFLIKNIDGKGNKQ